MHRVVIVRHQRSLDQATLGRPVHQPGQARLSHPEDAGELGHAAWLFGQNAQQPPLHHRQVMTIGYTRERSLHQP